MIKNIDELLKCYFEQKDILELKNNKKEKIGNTYLNFFTRRKTTEKKPEFNFGFSFIIEIIMIILSLIMGQFILTLCLIGVTILTLIILTIPYIKNVKRWKSVNEEYLEKVKNNEILLNDINSKVNEILKGKNELISCCKIVQNKILSGDITTIDEANLFLMNNAKNQINLAQDYWTCNYCEAFNDNKSYRCIFCGASKKD